MSQKNIMSITGGEGGGEINKSDKNPKFNILYLCIYIAHYFTRIISITKRLVQILKNLMGV